MLVCLPVANQTGESTDRQIDRHKVQIDRRTFIVKSKFAAQSAIRTIRRKTTGQNPLLRCQSADLLIVNLHIVFYFCFPNISKQIRRSENLREVKDEFIVQKT